MRQEILIISLIGFAHISAIDINDDMPVVTDEMVERINSSDLPWIASKEWAGEMTISEARTLLGAYPEIPPPERQDGWGALLKYTAIPKFFDSRKEWPNCIHPIRSQGHCGSCWAFGATEALSDRFCIQKGINVVLSPEFIIDCAHSSGCKGGFLSTAWEYMHKKGVVSEECDPYTRGDTGCINHCPDGGRFRLYKASAWRVYSDVHDIKLAIIKGGPVETQFAVFRDFHAYKSGIYVYDGTSEHVGGHAVKVIGWGEYQGIHYWICANSWGQRWGENGFFKIKFGECNICRHAYAADAD